MHRRPAGSPPVVVLALLGLAVTTALAATSNLTPRPAAPTAPVLAALPVSFEPVGDAGFVARGPGYSLALSPSEAVVGVRGGTFRLRPAGPTANPAAPLIAGDPLGATVTRLAGDDPSQWTSGVKTYASVDVRQVWPGVDMVWHGDQGRLRHDMIVAPGVDPAVVAFDVDGAASLTVDPAGDLMVDLGGTAARLARPVLYQDVDGHRREVPGAFRLLGAARIGFEVGGYDGSRPLVIDPTLVTSTLLGGGGNDAGYAVAVDAQGNTYVTGSTESTDFPSEAALQGGLANAGGGPTSDVFVSKLSPDGSRLVWSTYLGGRGRDIGYAVAVGADGGVYVTGVTESDDFPRARAAQDRYGGGPSDAFAVKLAPTGTALEWSTFVGGSQTDRARGLAVDAAGTVYITGSTNSVDFPAVTPYQPGPFRPDDLDAFLVKIPSAGGQLSYATRLGGSNDDRALAVAVDAQGNAYL
ncbi:MAG: SBBP repeat-containing protein, partial [Actinomycetota bacterium]|nr:SBBP repeat-containing protein [Actinomycetota bacterium]